MDGHGRAAERLHGAGEVLGAEDLDGAARTRPSSAAASTTSSRTTGMTPASGCASR
ncbi:Uncharacterised protein [Mycobacteroides abscessus]|nr:Uncharacterised protein [Mycobacteroides abscessus]